MFSFIMGLCAFCGIATCYWCFGLWYLLMCFLVLHFLVKDAPSSQHGSSVGNSNCRVWTTMLFSIFQCLWKERNWRILNVMEMLDLMLILYSLYLHLSGRRSIWSMRVFFSTYCWDGLSFLLLSFVLFLSISFLFFLQLLWLLLF